MNDLIKFWIKEKENTKKYLSENYFSNSSIHKLLILENFYNSNELIKIADLISKKNTLNSHELLLLAGFYFRVDETKKLKEIIKTKLPSQFDKSSIINNFSKQNNIYNQIQKLNFILASKIYNWISEDSLKNNSYSYQKIFLEFSLFLEPKMYISRCFSRNLYL